MAAADDLWCQGWSEPDAGSDLAGIKSRAARDDERGGWVLNGQKTWTTRGAFCNYLFGLFRTDPDAERHSGMTYFLVPLDAPGVTVRGVGRLDGDEGFAEVFFDDVFVGRRPRPRRGQRGLGRGHGHHLLRAGPHPALARPLLAAADRLVDLWKRRSALAATGDLAAVGAGDPSLRDDVAQSWMEAEAYRSHTLADVYRHGRGPLAGRPLQPHQDLLVRARRAPPRDRTPPARPHRRADRRRPRRRRRWAWMKGYEFSLSGPIYAGTNEIQRNVVAERVLGLPRK